MQKNNFFVFFHIILLMIETPQICHLKATLPIESLFSFNCFINTQTIQIWNS